MEAPVEFHDIRRGGSGGGGGGALGGKGGVKNGTQGGGGYAGSNLSAGTASFAGEFTHGASGSISLEYYAVSITEL